MQRAFGTVLFTMGVALAVSIFWSSGPERIEREDITTDVDAPPGLDTSEVRYDLTWEAPIEPGVGDHRSVAPFPDFNPLTGNRVLSIGPYVYNSVHLLQNETTTPYAEAGRGATARAYDQARYGMPGWNLPLDVLLEENGESVIVYDATRTPWTYEPEGGGVFRTREFNGVRMVESGTDYVATYGNGNQLTFERFAGAAPITHLLTQTRDKFGNRTVFDRDSSGRIQRVLLLAPDESESSPAPESVTHLGWVSGRLTSIVQPGQPELVLAYDGDGYLSHIEAMPISDRATVGPATPMHMDLYYVIAGSMPPANGNAYPSSLRAIEGPYRGARASLASVPVTTYHFDQAGRYARTIYPDNHSVSIQYDSDTAHGIVRAFQGWPGTTRQEMATSVLEISGSGAAAAVTASVDPMGLRTELTRDETTRRVAKMRTPSGAEVEYEYDPALGYTNLVTSADGIEESELDELGRLRHRVQRSRDGTVLADTRWEGIEADGSSLPDYTFDVALTTTHVENGATRVVTVTPSIVSGRYRYVSRTGGATRTIELNLDGSFARDLDSYGYGSGQRYDARGYPTDQLLVTPTREIVTGRMLYADGGAPLTFTNRSGVTTELLVDAQGLSVGARQPAIDVRTLRDDATMVPLQTTIDNLVRGDDQGDLRQRRIVDGCGRPTQTLLRVAGSTERRTMSLEAPFACPGTYERACERPVDDEGRPRTVNLGGRKQAYDWCDNPRAIGGCGWQVDRSCEYVYPETDCVLFPDPLFCRQVGT